MKRILIALFFISFKCEAQECTIVRATDTTYTQWLSVGTLSKYNTENTWVEQPYWTGVDPMNICENSYIVQKQQRIGTLTGILQERTRRINYLVVPIPKSEFQKVIDSVSK